MGVPGNVKPFHLGNYSAASKPEIAFLLLKYPLFISGFYMAFKEIHLELDLWYEIGSKIRCIFFSKLLPS